MSTLPLPIAAFLAGLVSFLSPCVLPLVPGYISLISGAGVEELKVQESRLLGRVMLNSDRLHPGLQRGIHFAGCNLDRGRANWWRVTSRYWRRLVA